MRVLAAKWRTREILCSQKTPVLAVACVFLMEFSCGPQTVSRQFTAVASVSATCFCRQRLCLQWRAFLLMDPRCGFNRNYFTSLFENACACSGVCFPNTWKLNFVLFQNRTFFCWIRGVVLQIERSKHKISNKKLQTYRSCFGTQPTLYISSTIKRSKHLC